MALDEEAEDKLRIARDAHIFRDRADRAKAALEPYRRFPETDIESAMRNFLADFLHLTVEHKGSAMEAGTLKALVDEAEKLYLEEEQLGSTGRAFEVSFVTRQRQDKEEG